jgi:divalent metal cation (Fe/Co/Zn/Cd) transporter
VSQAHGDDVVMTAASVGSIDACVTDGCCGPASIPAGQVAGWLRAARAARLLSWISLGWMSTEGVLGLVAGVGAGSISLLGWALGSVIEGLASVMVIWRFTGSRMLSVAAETTARKAVAVSLLVLASYLAVQSVHDLLSGHESRTSVLGISVTAASVLFMPALGVAKRRLGGRLGSAATAGEGMQNLLCAGQAATVLVGLALTRSLGWSWVDPVIGLVLAAFAIREGRRSWRGENCC